jgi:hypothetical protein
MVFSRAGRDGADDFFAIVVLTVRMNDEQNSASLGFNLSRA